MVTRLDRLARSTRNVLNILDRIASRGGLPISHGRTIIRTTSCDRSRRWAILPCAFALLLAGRVALSRPRHASIVANL
jgi:hypothetical protein